MDCVKQQRTTRPIRLSWWRVSNRHCRGAAHHGIRNGPAGHWLAVTTSCGFRFAVRSFWSKHTWRVWPSRHSTDEFFGHDGHCRRGNLGKSYGCFSFNCRRIRHLWGGAQCRRSWSRFYECGVLCRWPVAWWRGQGLGSFIGLVRIHIRICVCECGLNGYGDIACDGGPWLSQADCCGG